MAATGTTGRTLVVPTEWGDDEAHVGVDRSILDGCWSVVLVADPNVTFPRRVRMSPAQARDLAAALLLAAANTEKAADAEKAEWL